MERRMSRKLSRMVWCGGKSGDNLKGLPITINVSMDILCNFAISPIEK
jgi:hypothetical protein